MTMAPSLRLALVRYAQECRVELTHRADVVVALLRINTPESLRAAEELVGKKILKCPPAVPPWPPKPVSKPRCSVVSRVEPWRYAEGTVAQEKLSRVRPGMTRDQLLGRGLTRQQLYRWTRHKIINWRSV